MTGSNDISCNSNGICNCNEGYKGDKCEMCDTGYYQETSESCKGNF